MHPDSRYGSLLGAAGTIIKEEGHRGLWSGVSVTAAASAPVTAIYFGCYFYVRDLVSIAPILFFDQPEHSGTLTVALHALHRLSVGSLLWAAFDGTPSLIRAMTTII